MSWRVLLFSLSILIISGCSGSNKTIIYGEHNYKQLPKARNVTIKYTDGNTLRFHRMEIVGVDDQFIYARCWVKKESEPKELKFAKTEVIIEDTEFSTSNTFGYILSFAITIGVLYLLQRLIYD